MLNFRKLRQDFSPGLLKEGRDLHDKGLVMTAKVLHLDSSRIRLSCRVRGNFDNVYESEIEIDRFESRTIDSNCDCPYSYDCQHLAAFLYHLEQHLDEIVVTFSKETDLETSVEFDEIEKKQLEDTFKEAETKEIVRKDGKIQQELLQEYLNASQLLSSSPFFLPEEEIVEDKAEVAVIFTPSYGGVRRCSCDIQLALRLPFRSKPLHVVQLREFLDAVHYQEPIYLGGKRHFFTQQSFDQVSAEIIEILIDHAIFPEGEGERPQRVAVLESEAFGALLAKAYELSSVASTNKYASSGGTLPLPGLYLGGLETPLKYSARMAELQFVLEYLEVPSPRILLKPMVVADEDVLLLEEGLLLECAKPGFIYNQVYYRFHPHLKRMHLRNLDAIRNMTIPEPLFGTFVENAIQELRRYSKVVNLELIERFVTLPFVKEVKGRCAIQYLDGELEATFYFLYDPIEIPAAAVAWNYEHTTLFLTDQGVLARNLSEERKMLQDIFQDFVFDSKQGVYLAKIEKKIVEFMTEVIPRHQHHVHFDCPDNLLDQFIYDKTTFTLHFRESHSANTYEVELLVDGHLKGVKLDLLWECIHAKKRFIQLDLPKGKKESERGKEKVLVLDLEKIGPLVQLFDEIGVKKIDNYKEERPLWSLVSVQPSLFENLPVEFTMSSKLQELQQQMLGIRPLDPDPLPKEIKASLRSYQLEGVHWLGRLRKMHLNGILADDMGLGKTLQAIVTLTQHKIDHPKAVSMVVCPTSLLYNWKEEFTKFNPHLKVLLVDGIPSVRKKLLAKIEDHDVIITSYTLLQKDIDVYKKVPFSYAILDEAQHIKNRGTRNAKSVKLIEAPHRLILTGTPIENSLEELWSLFDFLMPGLLSSYDRFVEKYIRRVGHVPTQHLENLRKKVAPFILRRMKSDVLQELPPVSEITYYCHLSDLQKELYTSYAASAREELVKLVKKEGFDKVQIHVLATLTRLKQICCHPAIFAKEKAEESDSAKYEMLQELLQALIEGKHKTVIFSQYTKMLNILRDDLNQRGVRFAYLDGSTKNRLEIVKQFNEDESLPIFLVSLKAGGSGLNIVGADTVIHYDMWWNPAVENQATDRVHRLGQKRSVSSYKLITLGTIEEKILHMQERKKGLVKKVVSCDDEAMAKLTWEEVLELLQT